MNCALVMKDGLLFNPAVFCPACGADNEVDKRYCRKCGQSLVAVRLALDGRVDEVIKTVAGAEKLARYRLLIGIAGFFVLVAILTILTGGKFGFSNIHSAALILILITVFCTYLVRKSHRVARLLDAEDQSVTTLRGAASAPEIIAGASITEQSTRELKVERSETQKT